MNMFLHMIKRYKFENDLTQEQLAQEFNTTSMTIYRWFRGESTPNQQRQMEIQKYIVDKGTYIDPYDILISEIKIMQDKLDSFKNFLIRWNE